MLEITPECILGELTWFCRIEIGIYLSKWLLDRVYVISLYMKLFGILVTHSKYNEIEVELKYPFASFVWAEQGQNLRNSQRVCIFRVIRSYMYKFLGRNTLTPCIKEKTSMIVKMVSFVSRNHLGNSGKRHTILHWGTGFHLTIIKS